MPKYDIYAEVHGTVFLGTVEAESEEEALDKGEHLPAPSTGLCHQCSRKFCDRLSLGETIANVQLAEEQEPDE